MKAVCVSSVNIHRGNLILVNENHPYQEEQDCSTLAPVGGNGISLFQCRRECMKNQIRMDRNATILLTALMEEIADWTKIVPVSGWRSREEQKSIYLDSIEKNGLAFTRRYVAKPGHSEHQTGLAIDLGLNQPNLDFIRPDFPYTGICQEFRSRAPLFGFIERYPAGKEAITGIGHEPWHFRYVGMPHAAIMQEMNFTLEEYIEFVKGFSMETGPFFYEKKGCIMLIHFIQLNDGAAKQVVVDPLMPYTLSGNNVDGVIVTQWRRN